MSQAPQLRQKDSCTVHMYVSSERGIIIHHSATTAGSFVVALALGLVAKEVREGKARSETSRVIEPHESSCGYCRSDGRNTSFANHRPPSKCA
jgi:hypothetical protein